MSFSFEEGLDPVRDALISMTRTSLPPHDTSESLAILERFVPSLAPDAPPVRVVVTDPRPRGGATRPAILHIHSGGFVLGDAEMTRALDVEFARRLSAVVVSVDYRLAPETQFPGALEDCYAALAWIFGSASDLEVDPSRIAVAGQSAGAGLAAALALLVRDRGEFRLAFQQLTSAMLDDRTGLTVDPSMWQGEFVWTRQSNVFAWRALLGPSAGTAEVPYLAAPARAEDLSGLPGAFVACGALDLFLDENVEYGRRLSACGVPVEMRVYAGAPHSFYSVDGEHTRRYFNDAMYAMASALGIQQVGG